MTSEELTAAEDARRAVGSNLSALIARLAVEGYGATRHEDPVEGYRLLTRTRLEPATAGLEAALLVQRFAAGRVHEQAMAARGAGASWADIGLLLVPDAAGPGEAAERAYGHLVWGDPLPDARPPWRPREGTAHWVCQSCGQRVADGGPFNSHPDDCESGHAAGCERHRAALVAWQAAWGDE